MTVSPLNSEVSRMFQIIFKNMPKIGIDQRLKETLLEVSKSMTRVGVLTGQIYVAEIGSQTIPGGHQTQPKADLC